MAGYPSLPLGSEDKMTRPYVRERIAEPTSNAVSSEQEGTLHPAA